MPIDPVVRAKAEDIFTTIGKRFADNRKKGKSNAYEQYQRDLAQNAGTLIMGGALSAKEHAQLLMQLEEYRKQTSESGKTQATLLGEWLIGKIGDADVGIR